MSGFQGRRWTEAEIDRLRAALADPARPGIATLAARLAPEMGRTEVAIESRLWWVLNGGRPSRAGKDSKPGEGASARWERRCLKCRAMTTLPRGIFLCDACKATPEWRAGLHG